MILLYPIARYRNDTHQAESFYCHAASLVPSNGQPYNQLAIVSATKGDQLSMAFYYIRSIAVKHPFPAAATNLQTTYAKLVDRSVSFARYGHCHAHQPGPCWYHSKNIYKPTGYGNGRVKRASRKGRYG